METWESFFACALPSDPCSVDSALCYHLDNELTRRHWQALYQNLLGNLRSQETEENLQASHFFQRWNRQAKSTYSWNDFFQLLREIDVSLEMVFKNAFETSFVKFRFLFSSDIEITKDHLKQVEDELRRVSSEGHKNWAHNVFVSPFTSFLPEEYEATFCIHNSIAKSRNTLEDMFAQTEKFRVSGVLWNGCYWHPESVVEQKKDFDRSVKHPVANESFQQCFACDEDLVAFVNECHKNAPKDERKRKIYVGGGNGQVRSTRPLLADLRNKLPCVEKSTISNIHWRRKEWYSTVVIKWKDSCDSGVSENDLKEIDVLQSELEGLSEENDSRLVIFLNVKLQDDGLFECIFGLEFQLLMLEVPSVEVGMRILQIGGQYLKDNSIVWCAFGPHGSSGADPRQMKAEFVRSVPRRMVVFFADCGEDYCRKKTRTWFDPFGDSQRRAKFLVLWFGSESSVLGSCVSHIRDCCKDGDMLFSFFSVGSQLHLSHCVDISPEKCIEFLGTKFGQPSLHLELSQDDLNLFGVRQDFLAVLSRKRHIEFFHCLVQRDVKNRFDGLSTSEKQMFVNTVRERFLRGDGLDVHGLLLHDIGEYGAIYAERVEYLKLLEEISNILAVGSAGIVHVCQPGRTCGVTTGILHAMWKLHERAHCVKLKSSSSDALSELSWFLRCLRGCKTPIVVFCDLDDKNGDNSNIPDQIEDMCLECGENDSRVCFVVVLRDTDRGPPGSVVVHKSLQNEDVRKFRVLFESYLNSVPEADYFKAVESRKSPFLFGLASFLDDYTPIDGYVDEWFRSALPNPQTALLLICFVYQFTCLYAPVGLIYHVVGGKGQYDGSGLADLVLQTDCGKKFRLFVPRIADLILRKELALDKFSDRWRVSSPKMELETLAIGCSFSYYQSWISECEPLLCRLFECVRSVAGVDRIVEELLTDGAGSFLNARDDEHTISKLFHGVSIKSICFSATNNIID